MGRRDADLRVVSSRRTVGLAALAAFVALGPGCARPAPPHVVLFVVDTLRADHLGCYGYRRPTSPRIDAFARGATRYTRAWASSPWTLPTHASLFTGRFPFEHGAHTVEPTPDIWNFAALDDEWRTLAEVLRDAGYRTASFAANAGMLRSELGLVQGFETQVARRLPGLALHRLVASWLEEATRDPRPFFLFVNVMDAHRPYNVSGDFPSLPAPDGDPEALLEALKRAVMGREGPPPERLVRDVIDAYDRGVANADAAFGALLDALEERGVLDDALVVLSSDHGEYFGEHRLVEHSKDVYEPALRVPLVVKRPGQREERVDATPVSSAHVPRLVLDALPREVRPEETETLFPYAPGDAPLLAENHYARKMDLRHPVWGARFRRSRTAVIDGRWKLIRSSDGRHELYDLERDPAEARDRYAAEPVVARRLAEALERFAASRDAARPSPPVAEIGPEHAAQLRALGYAE